LEHVVKYISPIMRVLLLAPKFQGRKGWNSWDFCQEIGNQHDVTLINTLLDQNEMNDARRLVDKYKPDLILVHRLQFAKNIKNLSKIDLPKICFVEDYFTRHHDLKNSWLTEHDFDLVFFSQQYFIENARIFQSAQMIPQKTRFAWLPFSVDVQKLYRQPDAVRTFDVCFIACLHQTAEGYPNRRAVADILHGLAADAKLNVVCRLIENPLGYADPPDRLYEVEYRTMLKSSKLLICSLDATGSTNIRHFEGGATGCCIITDGPPNDWQDLKFETSERFIYKTIGDLRSLILERLAYSSETLDIAVEQQNTVLQFHSNQIRVREMFDVIRRDLHVA
jgi:hypothetical protein